MQLRVSIGTVVAGLAFFIAIALAHVDANIWLVYSFGFVAMVAFGIAMFTKEQRVKKQTVRNHYEIINKPLNNN